MRILEINKLYYPHIGGVETVVKQLAEGLPSAGIQVDVLVCAEKGKGSVEEINGSRIYRAASFGRFLSLPLSLQFFVWFYRLQKQYDAILIHEPFPLADLAIYLLSKKTKVYIWYHSDIVRQKFLATMLRPFLKLSLHRADKIFVASQSLIKNSSLLKDVSEHCVMIPFGIDLEKYKNSPEINKATTVIKEKYGRFILAVGRLVYYKGFDYLLEALVKTEATLMVIGTGPGREELLKRAKALNLEKKLIVLNPTDDLRPYYAACDFFVFPSIENSEAFGVVQIEAMAFSKAVINTSLATGVPEVSLNEISGLTVPPKNSDALAVAINKLWKDEDLCKKYGKAAYERVQKYYDEKKFIKQVAQELLN